MDIVVRRAAAADWAEIARVCADTGMAGAPVEERERASFAEHWIGPYRELRPDWTWVAASGGAVIGYLTGSPDTLGFEKERRRVFDSGPDARDLFAMPVRFKLWAEHPAHLMMNVAAAYRGRGAGTRLLQAFFAELRRAGVPSAHLVCGPNSHAFFDRENFRVEAEVPLERDIVVRAMTRLVDPPPRASELSPGIAPQR